MSPIIPVPIRRFIDATNAGDAPAFLDSFTADGFLSDWGRSFTGRDQLARWNQSDNIGVQSHLRIVSMAPLGQGWRARVAVRGNGFNGEGTMTFTLEGDRIKKLLIA